MFLIFSNFVWNREREDGMYFLLKWKDLDENQNTWEHYSNTDCVKLIAKN
jgi:hypothetical protein